MINSVDSLVANIIGTPTPIGKNAISATAASIPFTPWYGAGVTPGGSAPTGALNGATFSGVTNGAIQIPAAAAGETTRLQRLNVVQGGNIGMLWLIDRLWGNVPVVTTTGAQAVTSPTWPARDASASTSGAGVYLALECSAATGNGGGISNTSVGYTNSAGTSGRTANLAFTYPAGGTQGTFVLFTLQAGDVGVRSVQSVTLGTSYVSGQVNLIAFRLIADLPTPTANIASMAGPNQLGLPTIWDNSVVQMVYWPAGTSLGAVSGSLSYAQG